MYKQNSFNFYFNNMKEKKEKNDEWNDSTLKFFFLKAISSFFLFFLISYIECGKQLNVEKINK